MNIYLHIGPHKTGTTSIQQWLLKHADEGEFYYPEPEKYGPGHAVIAWKTMGIHNMTSSIDTIKCRVQEAKEKGYSKVVFSSEEFSKGILENSLSILQELKKEGKLILIVTLSELNSRFRSEMFESIKHNFHFNDIANPDVAKIMSMHPGLIPDFFLRVYNEINADNTYVCIIDKLNSSFIFDCFKKIIGFETFDDDSFNENPFSSYLYTLLLNEYNKLFPNIHFFDLRDLAEISTKKIIEKAPDSSNISFPGFNNSINLLLKNIWHLQLDHLDYMEKAGKIKLLKREEQPLNGEKKMIKESEEIKNNRNSVTTRKNKGLLSSFIKSFLRIKLF